MRASIASAIALCALGLASTQPAGATARASPTLRDEQTFQTTVHYGDLDLKTHAGATALYDRLSFAATRVCSDLMEPHTRMTQAYHKCRSDALSTAVQEINRPLLTQAYDQHAS